MEAPAGEKFRGASFVTLLVGPDKIVYNVHQDILCDASKVLKAAFSGDFKESSDRSISLEDEEPDVVEHMIRWLYSGKIHLIKAVSSQTAHSCYWQLAKLNTLADKYDMVHLKNSIVDELYKLREPPADNYPPALDVITYLYANTTKTSPFRKLVVAWYSLHIKLEWYDGTTQAELAAVPDFAADVAVALSTRIQYPNRGSAFKSNKSVYYEKET